MKHLIIGNGVAGITAARHIRMQDERAEISVVSDESDFFYSRTALMYVFMGDLNTKDTEPYERWFYKKNRIQCIRDRIESIDFGSKILRGQSGARYGYDQLLIAAGSKPRMAEWPGKELNGVCCFYGLEDLEELRRLTPRAEAAVVVGGGLIGVEMVEMLLHKGIRVHYLVRGDRFFPAGLSAEESDMVVEHIRSQGVEVIMNDELSIIEGREEKVTRVISQKGLAIPCQIAGIAIGVTPNIAFLADTDLATQRGILVDKYLATNQPGVWAAGDCAELSWMPEKRPGRVEQIWYTAKMQGRVAGRTMAGCDDEYLRGIWYNSAKFFDIDYHTFGKVNLGEPGEKNAYFRVKDANRSLRLVHRNGKIIGFNALGMRFRDAVCRRWIEEERSIQYVLDHLEEGWFEPEFARSDLREVVHA
ncbi:MAG: NAD(P)/FAD-dependent oxidoreductase [Chitinivibrionales bacterium]|nr:NAD(P)/FAD-dependent oxidoreductase [Chitinivibrionales bacterium]MBD3356101.1 NAD(P)/FAD-dependent oxidoreductase [Chitinivibrionales bacterium]